MTDAEKAAVEEAWQHYAVDKRFTYNDMLVLAAAYAEQRRAREQPHQPEVAEVATVGNLVAFLEKAALTNPDCLNSPLVAIDRVGNAYENTVTIHVIDAVYPTPMFSEDGQTTQMVLRLAKGKEWKP